MLDPSGKEVDWIVGYDPPPDRFLEKVQKSLRGEDTFRVLSDLYDKDPNDIAVVFKLARKVERRYSRPEKALELYERVLSLDPEGKAGTFASESPKAAIPYREYAEFALGRMRGTGQTADLKPLLAFIQKYPSSPLVESAYRSLSNYFRSQAAQEEAERFFEEWIAKFPDRTAGYDAYIRRIIRDRSDLDKGIQLAEKIREIEGPDIAPHHVMNHARLYILKGDKAKADELYGKEFMARQVDNFAYDLLAFAQFWAGENENLESAETMIEKALPLNPDFWFMRRAAADLYLRSGKEDKALAVFGPEFAKKSGAGADMLLSYASFWNRQGKNLESALEAAKKAVERESAYYTFDTLSQVQLKLKNYAEALRAAEKALALAQETAKKREGFPTKPYEDRLQKVKDAIAKEKK